MVKLAHIANAAGSARRSVTSVMEQALSRRAELPSLAIKIARQAIPPGHLFFRAILLTCGGLTVIAFAEVDSKVELLGYLLLLMAFNQTVMQFAWRSIDGCYSAVARQFGWPDEKKETDQG